MSANQAFMLATRHGGLALRRPDLGIVTEGAKADLVVFSGNSPGLIGWVDPVAAVILHSNVGDIQHVLVDGKFVKRDGQLTFNNYTGIQQRFLNSARRIQEVWKGIPYPVLVGQFGGFSAYQDPMQEDTLRGNGTGYGTLFV
jgi:cytosine/adenosine deaminase-related metal-dependent hydrolase